MFLAFSPFKVLTMTEKYVIINDNDNLGNVFMIKKQKISLKDIANAAGVSAITVSRALDPMRPNSISEATRDRICKLAEDMNYSSNLAARRFKKGITETITVVLPQSFFNKQTPIDFSAHSSFIFWQIIEGIIKTAKYWKYDIKLEPFMKEYEPESFSANITSPYSDGLILIGTPDDYSGILPFICEKNIPYLILSTIPSMRADIQEISFDLTISINEAFDCLFEKGRKKIAMLYPYEKPDSLRFRIFRERLISSGLYNENLSIQIQSFEELRKLVNVIKNQKMFDAVFCHNDTIAFYLIKEIRNTTSLRVPEDISVIGYDDNLTYDEMNLSTISLPRFQLGCEGVNSLINMIAGKETSTARKLLNTEFKAGSTC